MVAEVGAAAGRQCLTDILIEFEQAGIIQIDGSAIVGKQLGTHVETCKPVSSDEQPVAAAVKIFPLSFLPA